MRRAIGVLHASAEGRALYERLGFVATNEMRFSGSLLGQDDRSGEREDLRRRRG